MAFCLATYGKDRPESRALAMWFMMVASHALAPHALAHHCGLMGPAVLALPFGLPPAVLQGRRDVVSAMIACGLVDLMRFGAFGR